MTTRPTTRIAWIAATALALTGWTAAAQDAPEAARHRPLVELFTSQG